jgi:hypothetical protein
MKSKCENHWAKKKREQKEGEKRRVQKLKEIAMFQGTSCTSTHRTNRTANARATTEQNKASSGCRDRRKSHESGHQSTRELASARRNAQGRRCQSRRGGDEDWWQPVGGECVPVAPGGPSSDADSRSRCDRRPRRQAEGQSSGWGCPTGGCQQRSWHCGQHGGFIAGVLSGFSQGVIRYLLFCASGE